MKLIIGTPKAIDSLLKKTEGVIPEGHELCPTSWVYLNMSGGWTEEECDSVIYVMEDPRETLKSRS